MSQIDDDLELLVWLLFQSQEHMIDEQVAIDLGGLESTRDIVEDGIAGFGVSALVEDHQRGDLFEVLLLDGLLFDHVVLEFGRDHAQVAVVLPLRVLLDERERVYVAAAMLGRAEMR